MILNCQRWILGKLNICTEGSKMTVLDFIIEKDLSPEEMELHKDIIQESLRREKLLEDFDITGLMSLLVLSSIPDECFFKE